MERVNVRRLPDAWAPDDEALLQSVDDATATPVYIAYRQAGERLAALHGRAAGAATEDPERLASRLSELNALDLHPFDDVRRTHGSVLGPEGLAVYRRLAGPDG